MREDVKAQAGWADLSQDLKCLWGLSLATRVFANEEGSLHVIGSYIQYKNHIHTEGQTKSH